MFSCFNISNTDSTDNTDATCVYIDIYLRQGVSWSPTDSTDSHRCYLLSNKILTEVHNSML